ncbi:MAG: hypothetical protein IJ619_03605 [Eubacterium sp.]|nr:hypothetical protein [Eubacterium sp.]
MGTDNQGDFDDIERTTVIFDQSPYSIANQTGQGVQFNQQGQQPNGGWAPAGQQAPFGGQGAGQQAPFGGQGAGQQAQFGGQGAGQQPQFGGQGVGQQPQFGGQGAGQPMYTYSNNGGAYGGPQASQPGTGRTEQPPYGGGGASPQEPPKKKSHAGLIIGIIAGVLVLIGLIVGGIIFAFKSVLKKAEEALSTETTTVATGTTEKDTEENTTEATTEEDTTEEKTTESTTEEDTTEEDTTEATTEGDSTTPTIVGADNGEFEVDYPGTYQYALDTQRLGDDVLGYIDVPSSWVLFKEAGNTWNNTLAHQQYAYGMMDVITHVTYDKNMTNEELKGFADGLAGSLNNGKVQSARFGDNTGYLVTSVYNDGTTLRVFVFVDVNKHVQYLAVEGLDDEYSDVYRLVYQNYSHTK